jgi:cathepsin L
MKFAFSHFAVAGAFRDFSEYSFEDFQVDFNRGYGATESANRRELFNTALAKVNEQNELYTAGKSTWWATINDFSDQSEEEFAAMKGKAPAPIAHPSIRLGKTQNPTRKDWREDGVVSAVKDQGGCGSCWAFAATECVESHYMIATKDEAILAPQYYVNCVVNDKGCGGTGGCEGAIAELAFNLTAQVGIPLEKDLPYKGRDASCGTYPEAVTCDGYHHLSPNDPDELETALATVGPVAVSVAANWGMYGGGVYEGGCSSNSCSIDHAVLAVGYDEDYWLIRNSWGSSWGEKGYIRLTRKHDKDTFTDTRPADGFACKPYPDTQTVAGESGVLSDSAYPTNVRKASTSVQV